MGDIWDFSEILKIYLIIINNIFLNLEKSCSYFRIQIKRLLISGHCTHCNQQGTWQGEQEGCTVNKYQATQGCVMVRQAQLLLLSQGRYQRKVDLMNLCRRTSFGVLKFCGAAVETLNLKDDHPLPQAPSSVYLACGIGLFIYQSLDAIDGKHARRTGITSLF